MVTGAQGCIGSWVVKQLLDRGQEVLIYDLDPATVRLSKITTEKDRRNLAIEVGRIEDTARVKSLVRDEGITHIVHLAAVLMPVCQALPVAGGLVNVIGTLNVFEAARDSFDYTKPEVPAMVNIFATSCESLRVHFGS